MFSWMSEHQTLLWSVGVTSLVIFMASLLIIPAMIVRIQPDYFVQDRRPISRWAKHHWAIRLVVRISKNVLGVMLIVAGVGMLLLPGQGLLTILIGLMLVNFPGKYRFEQWLVSQPIIHRPINWLRRRSGSPPLLVKSRMAAR